MARLFSMLLSSAGCATVCTRKPWSTTRSRGRHGSAWAAMILGGKNMGSLNLCMISPVGRSRIRFLTFWSTVPMTSGIRRSWNGLRSAFVLGRTVWDSCKRFSLYCSWFKTKSKGFHPADLKENYQQHKRRTWGASDASIAFSMPSMLVGPHVSAIAWLLLDGWREWFECVMYRCTHPLFATESFRIFFMTWAFPTWVCWTRKYFAKRTAWKMINEA